MKKRYNVRSMKLGAKTKLDVMVVIKSEKLRDKTIAGCERKYE